MTPGPDREQDNLQGDPAGAVTADYDNEPYDDEDPDDSYVRVSWAVVPDAVDGWSLQLAQIGAGGQEVLVADLPLDDEGLLPELVDALAAAHRNMTGEDLLSASPADFSEEPAAIWPPSRWADHPKFRTIVITALVAIAVTLLLTNLT